VAVAEELTGIVAGNTYRYTRTITGIPAGDSIVKAWTTFKSNKNNADPGLFQKAITTTNVPGTGQITDTGAGDTIGAVRFDWMRADTDLLTPGNVIFFDLKVLTAAGDLYTVVLGTIKTDQGVTTAFS
jgi:hypothetical protein